MVLDYVAFYSRARGAGLCHILEASALGWIMSHFPLRTSSWMISHSAAEELQWNIVSWGRRPMPSLW